MQNTEMQEQKQRQDESLQPFSYDLTKSSLIEASAGCGKTYTLSFLYLRLLLGIGVNQPLSVEQILVITFTVSATEELKIRIRAVIKNLLDILNQQQENTSQDPELAKLSDYLNDLPEAQQKQAKLRLTIAFNSMSEASIHTIDGWCNKVLHTSADLSEFEKEREISTNTADLHLSAIQDFWRKFAPHFSQDCTDFFRTKKVNNPDQLGKVLNEFSQTNKQQIQQALEQKQANSYWQKAQSLSAIDFSTNFPLKTQKDSEKNLANEILQTEQGIFVPIIIWLENRKEFIKQKTKIYEHSDLPIILAKALQDETTGAQLAQNLAAKYPFAFVDEFQDTNAEQFQILNAIYKICAGDKKQKQEQEQEQEQEKALSAIAFSENQANLPLSAIHFSENPSQNQAQNQATLVLIGDPKQSIYRFRGADINSYLQARNCINNTNSLETNYRSDAELINSINEFFNFFDEKAQGAFNNKNSQITENAENLSDKQIQFTQVNASDKSIYLEINNQKQAPLKFLLVAEKFRTDLPANSSNSQQAPKAFSSKTDLKEKVAKNLAHKIAYLINSNSQICDAKTKRKVELKDISIIVNDRYEADEIITALKELNIEGIFKDSESTLTSSFLFRDLQTILQATNSLKAQDIKQALSTRLMNLSLNELRLLNEDPSIWDSYSEKFTQYKELWLKKSLGNFLDKFIQDNEILPKLRYLASERDLTDFLQLVELLQEKDFEHLQPDSLLDYLEKQADKQKLSAKQRFLTGDQRVEVVTIHKSKGLEYNLVFIPFAIHQIKIDKNQDQQEEVFAYLEEVRKFYVAITRAKICVWLGLDTSSGRDNLFEQSIFHFWLKQAQNSKAPTYDDFIGLLHQELSSFIQKAEFHGEQAPLIQKEQQKQLQAPSAFLPKNIQQWYMQSFTKLKNNLQNDFDASSNFTNSSNANSSENLISNSTPDFIDDKQHKDFEIYFDFLKRGKETGILLHTILELIGTWNSYNLQKNGFSAFVQEEQSKRLDFLRYKQNTYEMQNFDAHKQLQQLQNLDEQQKAQAQQQIEQKKQEELEKLEADILRILQTDLFANSSNNFSQGVSQNISQDETQNSQLELENKLPQLRLQDLAFKDYATELEFVFNMTELDLAALDNFAMANFFPNEARAKLEPKKLKGALKGIIDLLVQKDGKYYALDYKTNDLSKSKNSHNNLNLQANALENVQRNMQESAQELPDFNDLKREILTYRYDLQGIIYIYATHKILKARLEEYDPSKNLGGVGFIFLRSNQSYIQPISPKQLEELEQIFH